MIIILSSLVLMTQHTDVPFHIEMTVIDSESNSESTTDKNNLFYNLLYIFCLYKLIFNFYIKKKNN